MLGEPQNRFFKNPVQINRGKVWFLMKRKSKIHISCWLCYTVSHNCRHTTSGSSGCTAVTISKGAAKWFPSTLGIDLLLLIEDTNSTANCLFTFHLHLFFA